MDANPFSLEGSVALVTGGSRGIGEAIAVALADAGAAVVAVARSENALEETVKRIQNRGGDATYAVADVTADAEIRAAFDSAEETFGPVDVLVNNAGINPYFGDTTDVGLDTWQQIFDVNVTGTFRCTQEFGTRVFERGETGAIVNVASVGGVVALPYQTPYTASKHAIVGMTKCVGVEWAPEIRVNALAPGYVKTEFTEGVRENESIRTDILETIPQDRFAEPEEIAASAVYLASDAGAYVTGEIHLADGGLAAQ
jgi:NAD(P)-dependent dehydrogenase (short-subunit alcohol dehydrogenase family)